jgi:hypothetical protein
VSCYTRGDVITAIIVTHHQGSSTCPETVRTSPLPRIPKVAFLLSPKLTVSTSQPFVIVLGPKGASHLPSHDAVLMLSRVSPLLPPSCHRTRNMTNHLNDRLANGRACPAYVHPADE